MKHLRALVLVLAAGLLASCSFGGKNIITGSGNVITENRIVGVFTRLVVSCTADVQITQGGPQTVSIEGEDNIVRLIDTSVSGGTLTIDIQSDTGFSTTKPLVVFITVPEIESIRASGSGNVVMAKWSTSSANLETTGSGNITIDDLATDSLTARLSGSGDIILNGGSAVSEKINASGSGKFNGELVPSKRAEATTTGSGSITIWVSDTLAASTSGSGDIQYYGSPQLSEHITGSGAVHRIGDHP